MITGITLLCSILSAECEILWDTRFEYDTLRECQVRELTTAQLLNKEYKDEPVVFMYTCLEGSKL
jgi:hypothetical protein